MDEVQKEFGPSPGPTQQNVSMARSSPTVSELSVSAILDKDGVSIGCSPAPSNSSFLSEQEASDMGSMSRQSPFLSVSQPSPSSNFGILFPRPDFLNTSSMPDSETSSRSSLDGIAPSKRLFRQRRRKNSSDSSGSEGSAVTVGGDSIEGEEMNSRKNSKHKFLEDVVVSGRSADAPRGRIANIRRESNCSIDSEVAHERLVKVSQQVSSGFDEITIDKPTLPTLNMPAELRKRAPSVSSLGEPISIVTNSFLPHSCSPSPTRLADGHKQCYSPSTNQIVRPNIPYSPNPSPTQSPTRHRLLRSLSPITTRNNLKRRYTTTPGVMEEGEAKRGFVRNSTSPLVTDRSFPYPSVSTPIPSQEFAQPQVVTMTTPTCFITRRFSGIDHELSRRSSFESISDDQKSLRDNTEEAEMSEQSNSQRDDSMDVGDVSEKSEPVVSENVQSTSAETVLPAESDPDSSLPSTDNKDRDVLPSEPPAEPVISYPGPNPISENGSQQEMEMIAAAMEAPLPEDDDDL